MPSVYLYLSFFLKYKKGDEEHTDGRCMESALFLCLCVWVCTCVPLFQRTCGCVHCFLSFFMEASASLRRIFQVTLALSSVVDVIFMEI